MAARSGKVFLKAAIEPEGKEAQLDIQLAGEDALISWVLPLMAADTVDDQESPERSSTL